MQYLSAISWYAPSLAGSAAGALASVHPDYGLLGGRLEAMSMYQLVPPRFTSCMNNASDRLLLSRQFCDIVRDHGSFLDNVIVHGRDYSLTYAAMRTLRHSFLLKHGCRLLERPQHMFLRSAIATHGWDLTSVVEAYTLMSRGIYINAPANLRNAGCINNQMCTSFMLDVNCATTQCVFDVMRDVGVISACSGELGVSLHAVPSDRSCFNTTPGSVASLTEIFESTMRFSAQGTGKQPGSITLYLEIWHADIVQFIQSESPRSGSDVYTQRVLRGLWISDELYKWTLFCPTDTPLLVDTYGVDFDKAYRSYERRQIGVKQILAKELWLIILNSQLRTGGPFILYKDSINQKSNQKGLGVIRSSSLGAELMQYTAASETATCNLASIDVSKFANSKGDVDYDRLRDVVKFVTLSLDRVIDSTLYPTGCSQQSSSTHRAVGLGIQGLADLFAILRVPYDSHRADVINVGIFETLYIGALEASAGLAASADPYTSYEGSPASNGILQFDLWGRRPSELWDWSEVRRLIAYSGLRNSLLIAQTSMASTNLILGTSGSVDPHTSNIYIQRGVAGEFPMANRHLVADLVREGLWSDYVRTKLIQNDGSIQRIAEVPDELKRLYKTAWEIKPKTLLDLAISRAPFICHSQTMDMYFKTPSAGRLSRLHLYAWRAGLKTGMTCLRLHGGTGSNSFSVRLDPGSDPTMDHTTTTMEGPDTIRMTRTTMVNGNITVSDYLPGDDVPNHYAASSSDVRSGDHGKQVMVAYESDGRCGIARHRIFVGLGVSDVAPQQRNGTNSGLIDDRSDTGTFRSYSMSI
ncbi:alpha subunit of ribonucleoside-diphosphate reductase [Panus rudis PR-1116 ss-1]|nr:alpha subunit of ribonucleoside-diphosphate reductase [Panus rudis PR-1116 ss-1]